MLEEPRDMRLHARISKSEAAAIEQFRIAERLYYDSAEIRGNRLTTAMDAILVHR